MGKIKVEIGEYVRTKKGYIGKVIRFDVDNNLHCDNIISTICGEKFCWLNKLEQKEQIAKHGKNIIDLIEVGDYVNGIYVRTVHLEGEKPYIILNGLGSIRVYAEGVNNIVTHEQFNSMKYEVE